MLVLPVYLIGSTYYLHTRIAGKQIKRSLRTAYKREAMIRAVQLLNELKMHKKNLPAKYEIDAANGILKADGPDDHARLMQALEALKALQAGQQAPAMATNQQQNGDDSTLKLGELLEQYCLLKKILQGTAIHYKNIIDELAAFLKNPPITRITSSDVTRYQQFLATKKDNPNSTRTIDNKVDVLRALFNFAKKQGYTKQDNPAANRSLLTKKQKLKDGWAIFESEEVERFLASPFFAEQRAKDPDYTNVVLLALFTGCRVSEITSLKKDQFKTSAGGTRYIVIRESKTQAGIREVPLHPFVLAQLAPLLERCTDKLFKYTERDGRGSGNAVGKKFARNIESAGITRDKLVFHSLRKFVNNELMRNRVSIENRCQLVGHELDNVNISTYTDPISVDDLAGAVFPTFTLIAATVQRAFDPMRDINLGDVLKMDELL